jgi:predicted DNA-binding transcriptional regulator AlpA
MSATESRQAALEAVRLAAREAELSGDLAILFGELERARVEILVSVGALRSPGPVEDRLLSVAEVAKRIGRSKWWVYSNKDALPIVRLPTGRYGFSERGLSRWIERRAAR